MSGDARPLGAQLFGKTSARRGTTKNFPAYCTYRGECHGMWRPFCQVRGTTSNGHMRLRRTWRCLMPGFRSLWLAGFITLILAIPSAVAAPKGQSGGPQGPPAKVLMRNPGQVFCPSAPLVYGAIFIPTGRCYVLSVLRNGGGTFLAFVPPDTKIPPGQLVRLNTPAGPKVNGRMFLVPIQTNVVLVPVNTVTLVATRIEDFGPRLAIVLLGTPAPNLTIVFNVHL